MINTSFVPIKRDAFFNSLKTYSTLSKSNKKPMALVLVDIENFSQTNLQFGFQTGEMLMTILMRKMEGLAKFANCTFRISDSVRALILPVIESENLLTLVATKIIAELRVEASFGNYNITPSPRVGMAAKEGEDLSIESIYKEAEEYLIAARETGQEFVLHLEREQLDDIENFAEKFYTALNGNEFELYYQPKKDFSSGETRAAEALLRWRIDGDQFVSPERIVSEAEKSVENNFNLTKWVVNKALRQLKDWKDDGIDISVSVNVSPSLIHRADFITMIRDALTIWGVKPEKLVIEITETAFMSKKDLCHENLNTLRNLGLQLSIDDFGTGYSSLSYFNEIPATELKIDKAFVLDLTQSKENQKLVRLMIEIAHSFNLTVVAEGIEDQQAYDYLQSAGCDYAQGYFISKPVDPDSFSTWLAKGN